MKAKGRPPSRGAWIEIIVPETGVYFGIVAPPRGGRGLKFGLRKEALGPCRRPPSRGAWIEMLTSSPASLRALRSPPLAGGVD